MCEHCNKNEENGQKDWMKDLEDLKDVKGFDKIAKSLGERKYEDLSGMKSSRLTAIRPVGREKTYGRVLWLCECECSGKIIVEATTFKRNKIKSCGCMQTEKGKNLRDLTGEHFGKLLVKGRAEEDYIGADGRHRPRWICSCKCGGTIILRSRQLLSGAVTCCDDCNPKKRRKVMSHDLTGKVFNRLTVISRAENSNDGHTRWLCRCSCGQLTTVLGKHILSGAIKSCGCYSKDHTTAANLLHQKFGRWTVVEKLGKDENNNVLWKVICECGNEGIKSSHALTKGISTSCGCGKRDRAYARRENLVGRRFHNLTVIEKAEDHVYPSGAHRPRYLCMCDCGRTTYVTSNSLKTGSVKSCGCMLSYGEKVITDILESNKIKFKKQKSYKDLLSDKGCKLRFDFYIEKGKYLIEYDGQQHFEASGRIWSSEEHLEKVQKHDQRKNDYCREHGISLIRIPYTHLKNICLEDLLLETTKFRVI